MVIRYAGVPSYPGWVLIAATEKGLCRIMFGDSPKILQTRLKADFPDAILQDNEAEFKTIVSRVLAFLDAPENECPLPLDLQGTAFQRRVWAVLQTIPPGSTASYGEIARKIGNPRAARAVARACAANPVAVAVPCHRVIRGNGDLGGYRWGVERKRALLERESRRH